MMAFSMEDIIIVDNLHKTYGKNVIAVNGISFTVKNGEIFGFLGPNGAAKAQPLKFSRHCLKKVQEKQQSMD